MDASLRAVSAPAWSGKLTTPLAALIPPSWHSSALAGIKAIHTAIFASVGAAILLVVWDGLRQRPRQRSAIAVGIVLVESAVYVSNNQVCPLTPLAEELGAERGSVADIFLPDWASSRIPIMSGSILVLGLVLNATAWLRGRRR
jgi:hypothetical protein